MKIAHYTAIIAAGALLLGVTAMDATAADGGEPQVTVKEDGSWILHWGNGSRAANPFSDYCVGRFTGPRKVAGKLEWGAEQTCEGNSKPQWMLVQLQSTCPGTLCVVFPNEGKEIRTPFSEDNTRVSRVFRDAPCGANAKRVYRIQVKPYARGVQFPTVFSGEKAVDCDISP